MKVVIATTIDVDAEAWAAEFGVLPIEVRQDVKTYFAGLVDDQLARLGLESTYRSEVRQTFRALSDEALAYQSSIIVGGVDREECDREVARRGLSR